MNVIPAHTHSSGCWKFGVAACRDVIIDRVYLFVIVAFFRWTWCFEWRLK